MKLEAHPEESSSRTRGTSTSCIMRIQRSVAHTCNGLRPGAAKSEIWQAEGGGGVEGRTNHLPLGSRCPNRDPRKLWENIKKKRRPAFLTSSSYTTPHRYTPFTATQAAPLKVLPSPAVHPTTDHCLAP